MTAKDWNICQRATLDLRAHRNDSETGSSQDFVQDYGLLTTRKEHILMNIYTYVACELLTVLSVFLRADCLSLVPFRQPH